MAMGNPVVNVVSAGWVEALGCDWPGLATAADVAASAQAAEATWGLAGLRWSGEDDWLVVLLTPASHVPRRHPLAAAGLGRDEAGLLALWSSAGEPAAGPAKWLIQALAARLVDRCPAIETQASSRSAATACSPAVGLVTGVGFRPVPDVPLRYRLDLTRTEQWAPLRWARRWSPHWVSAPKPAPATRQVRRMSQGKV